MIFIVICIQTSLLPDRNYLQCLYSCVDFAIVFDEIVVIFMVNSCSCWCYYKLFCNIICSELVPARSSHFAFFIEDVSAPHVTQLFCLCFDYWLVSSFPLKRLILVSYSPSPGYWECSMIFYYSLYVKTYCALYVLIS